MMALVFKFLASKPPRAYLLASEPARLHSRAWPLVFGALWCPQQAAAAVVYKTGELCVDVETTVVDLAGDEWTESGPTPRAANGVKFEVTDTVSTTVGYLDADGCVSVGVWVESNNGTLQLRVSTRAFVNGVFMESWEGDDYNASPDFDAIAWTISTGTGTTFSRERTVGSNDQRWLNLMVGTMVFRLYDWNVEEPNGRGCCIEGKPGYDDDGTCTDPATGDYELLTTPIQLQAAPNGDCCGSTLLDTDEIVANEPPGLKTSIDAPYKFSIAHELGHVIVEMRMGSKEWREYDADVPENGCDGEGLPQDKRGSFTKEPLSNVLRESWGDFVSAVTWNSRSQDDCEFQAQWAVHDFDLDGDFDNDRTGTSMDGAFDCEGIPTLSGDPAIESYVTSENWLDDLEDADDDNADSIQCVRDSNSAVESYHRSTVYDGLRFLWDMTTDQAVHPDVLSDVYVDMCPRGWYEEDFTTLTYEMPFLRLDLSTDFHGVNTEAVNEIGHLLH